MVVYDVHVRGTTRIVAKSGWEYYHGDAPPMNPVVNDRWFDTRTHTFWAYTGDRWVKVR